MTAKEMFEKLGFEFDKTNSREDEYITYKRKNEYGYECIDFDFRKKKYRISFINFKLVRDARYSTYEELQAINKQVEELGWNKE